MNKNELKEEWVQFKQMMSKNFSDSSLQGIQKKTLSYSELQEQFPQILKLLTIALTVPVSSADCEQDFCKQNLIKTKNSSKAEDRKYQLYCRCLQTHQTYMYMYLTQTFTKHLYFGVV